MGAADAELFGGAGCGFVYATQFYHMRILAWLIFGIAEADSSPVL